MVAASLALLLALGSAATVEWYPKAVPPADQRLEKAAEAPESEDDSPRLAVVLPASSPVAQVAPAEPYPCAGKTKSGRQCRRLIRKGKYCYQHKGQTAD